MTDHLSAPRTRTVVIAAGGTGGHLFPAQALAEELTRRGCKVVLMTDDRGRTYADAFPQADIRMVNAATFAGRSAIGKIGAAGSIGAGVLQAWQLMGRLKPSAVVGFGGYPALPAMAGASLRGIPTCIHEQNAILGRVNRAMAARVDLIASAFDRLERVPAAAQAKAVVTGNPVRAAIVARRHDAFKPPHNGGPIRLLVFGGSQGARIFGEVVPQALTGFDAGMRSRLRVTQQVREENLDAVRTAYREAGIEADCAPFFTDMAERISASHLVIGRAGASTVTELAVIGRPSILVPLPSAMDDHQTVNARVLSDVGGAWPVPEPEFTPEALRERLGRVLTDNAALIQAAAAAWEAGRPEATSNLTDLVEGLTDRGHDFARDVLANRAAA